MATAVAALLFGAVVLYAVFGGADYGCGLWDLTAGTGERADRMRAQIDRSIGPVWEANHVWLIFILVYLWTGFPAAFAIVMTRLAIPFAFVGLGVIFRGGAFAFRKSSPTKSQARLHSLVFGVASVLTPFFLGTIAGAVAGGRTGTTRSTFAWLGPLSLAGGLLAVVTTTFMAATLLAADASKANDDELAAVFGRRAFISGLVAGVVALVAAVTIERAAPTLAHGLHGRASPLVVISAIGGVSALADLRANRWARARVGAAIAVTSVVLGWGVAQYPHLLVKVGTINELAGARQSLIGLLVVGAIAAVTVGPSLLWLYVLVERPQWKRPTLRRRTPARSEERA